MVVKLWLLCSPRSPVGHPCLSVVNFAHAQTATHLTIKHDVLLQDALPISCVALPSGTLVYVCIARLLLKRLVLHFGVHGGPLSLPARVAGTCLSSYAWHSCTTSVSF